MKGHRTSFTSVPRTLRMVDLPFLVEIAISRRSRLQSRKTAMAGCERASHDLYIGTKNAQNGGLAFFGQDCNLLGIQIAISRNKTQYALRGHIPAARMASLKEWRANGEARLSPKETTKV